MSKRKIRIRPGRAQSGAGLAVGIAFVIIGLFIAIPQFGGFGVVWTIIAVGITLVFGVNTFSSRGIATSEIEIDEEEMERRRHKTPEERLKALQQLYDQKLISKAEFEEKKKEILKTL